MTATSLPRRRNRWHRSLRESAVRAAGFTCLVALSVALGNEVAALGGGEPDVGVVLAGAGAVLGCMSLVALGTAGCLEMVGGLAAAGLLPVMGQAHGGGALSSRLGCRPSAAAAPAVGHPRAVSVIDGCR